MSKIKDKIIEKLLNKINIEELTDKIAEKVAEKIIDRNLKILDPDIVPPSIPNPAKPEPYYPWRDNIVVMYGVSTTPYRTSPYTITTSANVIKKKDKNEVNKK